MPKHKESECEEEFIETEIPSNINIKTLQCGVLTMFGEITIRTVEPIISSIILINNDPNFHVENLTLLINSYGGEVPSAFALVDIIAASRIPIHTVGVGLVASCALFILTAGKKGYRSITPNTSLMSHQWSGGRFGKKHELMASRKEDDIITEKFIAHYSKHTKIKNKKMIEKIFLPASDQWFTTQEALKYGLCDKVSQFDLQS